MKFKKVAKKILLPATIGLAGILAYATCNTSTTAEQQSEQESHYQQHTHFLERFPSNISQTHNTHDAEVAQTRHHYQDGGIIEPELQRNAYDEDFLLEADAIEREAQERVQEYNCSSIATNIQHEPEFLNHLITHYSRRYNELKQPWQGEYEPSSLQQAEIYNRLRYIRVNIRYYELCGGDESIFDLEQEYQTQIDNSNCHQAEILAQEIGDTQLRLRSYLECENEQYSPTDQQTRFLKEIALLDENEIMESARLILQHDNEQLTGSWYNRCAERSITLGNNLLMAEKHCEQDLIMGIEHVFGHRSQEFQLTIEEVQSITQLIREMRQRNR